MHRRRTAATSGRVATVPFVVALVLALVLALAACGGGGDPAAQAAPAGGSGATVTVETFTFGPDPIAVEPGTTITFVNGDAIDHTVTAGTREQPEPGRFDGSLAEEGSTFELTLDEPGTYDYFCRIHDGPGMTASITVG
jgi:plastocyanin